MSALRVVDADESTRVGARLVGLVLSGDYCLAGDPAAPSARLVFEEFGLWRPEHWRRLRRVLAATACREVLALEYAVEAGRIRFTGGHAVPATLGESEWQAASEEAGFGLNGTEYHLCDASARWSVGSIVDVQFFAGDEALLAAWLPEAERAAAIDGLRELLSAPRVRPEYKRLVGLQRP